MNHSLPAKSLLCSVLILMLSGCLPDKNSQEAGTESDTGSVAGQDNPAEQTPDNNTEATALDIELQNMISDMALNQHPQRDLPDISEPLPQLGKKLFFTKSLGGQFDAACVTCHHPALGGADELSLPVGTDAISEDLLGEGRVHATGLPIVPRNAPTVFNTGLWDRGLFHDSRVSSLNSVAGTNGSNGDISTPDSGNNADQNAGANLSTAQARFPVTSVEEMRGNVFEAGNDNSDVRDHLAARIGNYGEGINELGNNDWLNEFREAFGSNANAETLITFDNIVHAIGEYERSMTLTEHRWQQYMDGNLNAITDTEKQGARLFFLSPQQGGAGCVACHSGQLFSDERHHVVAFPQIGPGTGDGATGDDDFGRERITNDADDRYRFRTASLLNIALTAPYGHSGSYASLEQVVRHYINPQNAVQRYFQRNDMCRLPQFRNIQGCNALYPNAQNNSAAAAAKLTQEQNNGTSRLGRIRLGDTQVDQLVAFLEALTDPCAEDRECLSDWIPEANEAADDHQLNARNAQGELL